MANFFAQILMLEEMEAMEERQRSRRIRRNLRDSHDPFQIPEKEFIATFRLNKEAALFVIENIRPHMIPHIRISAIPHHIRILAVLNFLAVGSYQRSVGNNLLANMSQPMISQSIKIVCNTLIRHLVKRCVIFPRNEEQRHEIKISFQHYNMPHVIGIVDGTHVAIVKPKDNENEHIYVNRKGYHSLNVQIICDSRGRILSCLARYPGSSHDSHIWRHSLVGRTMRANFEHGDQESKIIGDSGYPCLPWLLTPITHPRTVQEINYNNILKRVRSGVERCIGILKGRFRCLLKDRTLHYKPTNAARIIIACAVLHNIAINFNVPNPEPALDEIDFDVPAMEHDDPRADIVWRRRGQNSRQEYINNYF